MSSSMYSATQRLGTFVSFFFSSLLTTLAVIGFSNYAFYYYVQPRNIDFKIRNVSLYRGIEDPYMNKPATLADLRFDLSVDFGPVFHWNSKQVYLYLVLEYQTSANERNEMIIWDKIIQSPQLTGYAEGSKFQTKNSRNKYPITDIADQLNGTDARIRVKWETVSHVGKLWDNSHNEFPIKFPLSIPAKN